MSLQKPKNCRELRYDELEYNGGSAIEGCPDWLLIVGAVALVGLATVGGLTVKSCLSKSAPKEITKFGRSFSPERRAVIDNWVSNGGHYCYEHGGALLWKKSGGKEITQFLRFDVR